MQPVPRLRGQKPLERCAHVPEGRQVFFRQLRALLRQPAAGVQRARHAFEPDAQLAHEIIAPDRLRHVRAIVEPQALHQLLIAALRIFPALQVAVELEDLLRQRALVTAAAEHIQRGVQLVVLAEPRIGLLKRRLHGTLGQRRRVALVADAEVRRKLQLVRIIAQDRRAEGVNRGDLRQIDPAELPLQKAVARVGREAFAELSDQLAAQLRGGRLGEGDHQELVDVAALLRDATQHALDQHAGLSRPGGRRDQNRAAAVRHRARLCAGQFSHDAPPPPACSRIPPA